MVLVMVRHAQYVHCFKWDGGGVGTDNSPALQTYLRSRIFADIWNAVVKSSFAFAHVLGF